MDLFEQSFGNELTDATRKKYAATLMKWMEHSKKHITEIHPDTANDLLHTFPIKHTPENHHGYLTAMVAYHHYVVKDREQEEKWTALKRKNWEPIQQRYDENRPSEHQEKQIMPFEAILQRIPTLTKGSMERLLLACYTLWEANRADYFATELIRTGETATEENYIVDHTTLMIRDFKTKARYTTIENRLPPELQEELKDSLEIRPRKYLFTREDNSPYPNRKQFSNWACRTLTSTLNHPMTLTTLRHLYIGYHMKEKTGKELTEMARKMGHTRSMQRAYEWIPAALPRGEDLSEDE